jgi:hypothetical protein
MLEGRLAYYFKKIIKLTYLPALSAIYSTFSHFQQFQPFSAYHRKKGDRFKINLNDQQVELSVRKF